MRECGSCTLCCKLLGVAEIEKPRGEWCQHCTPGRGCSLHEVPSFPKTCGEFECLWKQGVELPLNWRPDRIGIVFSATKDDATIALYVDRGRGTDSMKRPDIDRTIRNLASAGYRLVAFTGKNGVQEFTKQPEKSTLREDLNRDVERRNRRGYLPVAALAMAASGVVAQTSLQPGMRVVEDEEEQSDATSDEAL